MSLAERIRSQALDLLGRGEPTQERLNEVLRLLAKYRSVLIQNTVLGTHGPRVQGGPFAGMEYLAASAEGCHVPKLLGCYEQELHPVVEAAAATGYEVIANLGSAEGYYAVGLARRCPAAGVVAHDDNPAAQDACRRLAAANGVADRVAVAGRFGPESFRDFLGRRALFVIDIEGHELGLIEGVPAAGLAGFDLVVECHDGFGPPVTDRLTRHLAATHDLAVVRPGVREVRLPPLFDRLGHLDQLLAVWEWRSRPTPWLLAAARQPADSPFRRAVLGAAEGGPDSGR